MAPCWARRWPLSLGVCGSLQWQGEGIGGAGLCTPPAMSLAMGEAGMGRARTLGLATGALKPQPPWAMPSVAMKHQV